MSTHVNTLIAAALLLAGGVAAAQAPESASLESLTDDADLVFQGTVTGIAYGPSTEGIPHTFVTYRVEDVLKGDYGASTLTLRFVGGEIVKDGVLRRLSVSHAPRFESGQQDLMMVKGNAKTSCPLVRCAQGRFHFDKGMVVNANGDVLARDRQGGVQALTRAEQASVDDFGAGAKVAAPAADADATPFDGSGFVAHVRESIGKRRAATMAKTAPNAVESADPAKAFTGPAAAVASPPRERPVAPQSAQSEYDRLENEALRRNGGNPVLPAADVAVLRKAAR